MQCSNLLPRTAFLLFILVSIQSSMSTKVLAARRMVGGYTPANVQDQSVIEAAELVVQNLKEGQGPIERYTFEFPVGSGTSGNFEMKILEASQQVVAGINYELQIGIFVGLTCIGGISSNVYRNLKGEFSVISYGKELSCDEVERLEYPDGPKEEE